MSVNGVTTNSVSDAYSNSYNSTAKKTKSADKASTTTNNGVIYEASAESTSASTKKTYTPNTELIQKMKADAESRSSQFQSIVTQMLSKQGNAYGNANSIWSGISPASVWRGTSVRWRRAAGSPRS